MIKKISVSDVRELISGIRMDVRPYIKKVQWSTEEWEKYWVNIESQINKLKDK